MFETIFMWVGIAGVTISVVFTTVILAAAVIK